MSAGQKSESPFIYDIDAMVLDWRPVREKLQKKGKNFRAETDLSGLEFISEAPHYESTSPPVPVRSSSLVYQSTVSNTTDVTQTTRVKATKKVHGYCRVALRSAIKKGGEVDVTLRAPSQVSAYGFPSVVKIRNETHHEANEDIECHVDTPVVVMPGRPVKVTVKAIERSFASEFSVRVRIRGKIVVRIYKGDRFQTRIEGNLRQIADSLIAHDSKLIPKGDSLGSDRIGITVTLDGHSRFQFVVDQCITISYAANPQENGSEASG